MQLLSQSQQDLVHCLLQRAFCDESTAAALAARGCKSSVRSDAECTACGCIDCRWLMAADILLKRFCVTPCCLLPKAAGRGRQVDSSSGFQRLASCAHAGMPAPTKKTGDTSMVLGNTWRHQIRRFVPWRHCVVQPDLKMDSKMHVGHGLYYLLATQSSAPTSSRTT